MFGLTPKRLVGLALMAVLVWVAMQIVPPYISSYQLEDFVRQEVKYASSARRTPEQVRRSVLERARQLELPIDDSQIVAKKEAGVFSIQANYEVPFDFKVYQGRLVFSFSETGEKFEP